MTNLVFTSADSDLISDELDNARAQDTADSLRMYFLYNGLLREVKPFGFDDNDNLKAVVLNEEDEEGKHPFKKFAAHRMHNVVLSYYSEEEEEVAAEEAPAADTAQLRRKLDALKIFRPQHVAAADALLGTADSVDQLRSAAEDADEEAAEGIRETAERLLKTIEDAITQLSV